MTEQNSDVRGLIELIAKSLVDKPEEVYVDEVPEDGEIVLELEVAEEENGKIIGRHGRTVKAMRTLVNAAGFRQHKRYALEILE
ncbi:MAG TPA: KH domain-containing protein [Terriglobales bacterium]|nr:KH domain-containing protein [Terriglobales bacterium]